LHTKLLREVDNCEFIGIYDKDSVKAKEAGAEFGVNVFETLEDLKNAIRKNLQEGYDKRSHQELQEQIFEKLLTESFELPETLVKMELDGIIDDTEMRFSQSNMTLDQLGLSREKLEEEYRDVAEKQVRRHLFLSKIIEQEKMELNEEQLNQEYEAFAKAVGQPVDFIKNYYKTNPEKLDGFKHALLEKKVFDLILEKAEIEDVEPETVTP
ncbi:MAG: hypothetical protein M0Z56_03850, partial [Desulfobacteraceae bacterium]|nr:hypothetical protein [Desulfobacteraceae bacterium]